MALSAGDVEAALVVCGIVALHSLFKACDDVRVFLGRSDQVRVAQSCCIV